MIHSVLFIVALTVAIGAGWGYWAWIRWETYTGPAKGFTVAGDPTMAPTGNLLHNAYMKFWGWRTVVVIGVDRESAAVGYRFGYRALGGESKLHAEVHHGSRIKARVGNEDPVFILIREDGKEATIKTIIRTTKDDPDFADVPLM